MSNRTFLLIHSGIYGAFATALFVIPALMWPLYGVEVNDQYTYFLSQHNSIFLGGIAILGFTFREIESGSQVARKLFSGLMWTNILGSVITLYACLTHIFTGFGWSDPAFFILLSVLCYRQIQSNKQ